MQHTDIKINTYYLVSEGENKAIVKTVGRRMDYNFFDCKFVEQNVWRKKSGYRRSHDATIHSNYFIRELDDENISFENIEKNHPEWLIM